MAPNYEIQVVPVEAKQLAVVKDVAYAQNIGPKIGANMPAVFGKLAQLGVTGLGQGVVAYFPHQGGDWNSPPGIPIEVGVELATTLPTESAPVVHSSTPACRAASTLHAGPYQDLPAAHMAIHAWCRQNGHAMTGPNWEVYGEHHADDPSKLRTHVYYELK
jgi:effector-binding domain-containing protein